MKTLKRIQATQFKTNCLSILDHIDSPLVILKRGKPVALLTPYQEKAHDAAILARLRNRGKIHEDISRIQFSKDWK